MLEERLQSVSILTDSWEPVQRSAHLPGDFGRLCFNPHRLLGAGATDAMIAIVARQSRFQSSPTPGSRCNPHALWAYCLLLGVSILTDSWESVQHSSLLGFKLTRCSFNPHRLLGVGATEVVGSAYGSSYLFQSSPTPGSRCNSPTRKII